MPRRAATVIGRRAFVVASLAAWCSSTRGARGMDGSSIFQEAFERESGYGDYTSAVTMILKDRGGGSIVRKMELSNLEVRGDGTRTRVVFENPPDVKGTTVLTAAHEQRDDEQWIYLPAFKRVKQISTANQAAAFMGSEFSYEDVNSINIQPGKFTYRQVREEMLGARTCWVVERMPKYEHSAYRRELVWLDKAEYTIQRVEYFDGEDKPFKTLTMEDYEKYIGRFWRPKQMTMANLQNGKSTILRWERYRFQSGVRAADFNVAGLKK